MPSFPEATAGIEAAVEYVNAELGGVDGHPIELATCLVQAEEDGQRCATEMVNDDDVSVRDDRDDGRRQRLDLLDARRPEAGDHRLPRRGRGLHRPGRLRLHAGRRRRA